MRRRDKSAERRIPNNLCSCLSLRRQRKLHSLSLTVLVTFIQRVWKEREREKKSSFYWWTWKYYLSPLNKVNNTVSHVDTMDPWFGVIRMVPYLHSLSPQKHKPTIIIRNIRPVQIILQNTWSVLFENSQSHKKWVPEKLSQPRRP